MSLNSLLLAMLLCGLSAAITGVNVDTILAQYKQSLQTLWNMRNVRSVYVNPNEDACFDWYFKAIDDNMNIYWNNSSQCNNNAYGEIKLLNALGDKTRYDLVQRERSICDNFEWCEEKSDLLDFYDCYRNVSTNSTPVIYKMSVDSNAEYETLLVKYNDVDAYKNICDENVRDEYIKNSAETDRQFQACRDGNGVPTKPTTTQKTTTDTTTTIEWATEGTTEWPNLRMAGN